MAAFDKFCETALIAIALWGMILTVAAVAILIAADGATPLFVFIEEAAIVPLGIWGAIVAIGNCFLVLLAPRS